MQTSSYQTPELEAIRQRIDALDNQVHALLMERANLVMRISAEKKKHGIQIVQPAREARMMRRLLAKHEPPLPEETIVRIWRELVGSISLLQTGFSVAVYAGQSQTEYWDMARDYFGTVLPMHKHGNASSALDALEMAGVDFAVLPLLEITEENPWWARLFDNPKFKIIQKLPFGHKENYNYEEFPALVLSTTGFDTSDDDHSLIGLQFDQPIDISEISHPDLIKVYHSSDFKNVMVELQGYHVHEVAIRSQFAGLRPLNIRCFGGFPSPLNYKNSK